MLREIIALGSQATNNNNSKAITLVAVYYIGDNITTFITLVAAERHKWLNCLLSWLVVLHFCNIYLYCCIFALLYGYSLYINITNINKSVVLYCQVADNFNCCRFCMYNLLSVLTVQYLIFCSTQYFCCKSSYLGSLWQLDSLAGLLGWCTTSVDKIYVLIKCWTSILFYIFYRLENHLCVDYLMLVKDLGQFRH